MIDTDGKTIGDVWTEAAARWPAAAFPAGAS